LGGNEGGDEEDGGEKSGENEGWLGHEERIVQRGGRREQGSEGASWQVCVRRGGRQESWGKGGLF
jgi:hypothetical protein